jgi:hypothetical protein
MDFVDSATGTERRGHDATLRGHDETEVGVANMKRHEPSIATTTATETSTAPAAVPAGNVTSTTAGGVTEGSSHANAL